MAIWMSLRRSRAAATRPTGLPYLNSMSSIRSGRSSKTDMSVPSGGGGRYKPERAGRRTFGAEGERMRRSISALLFLMLAVGAASGQTTTMPWTQLSRSTCGVDAWLEQHPDRDGRGVEIAVLDTGVDVAVAGLNKMPDGTPKVIDVQDFCGEGEIELTPATLSPAGDKLIRYDKDGAPQEYVLPPTTARPEGSTLWLGVIAEKAFANTSVPDINDNGK